MAELTTQYLWRAWTIFSVLLVSSTVYSSEDQLFQQNAGGAPMKYRTFQASESEKPERNGEDSDTDSVALVLLEDEQETPASLTDINQDELLPFLRWMKNDLIDPSPASCLEGGAGGLGMAIGLFASYASAPLAGEFGIFLLKTVAGTTTGAMNDAVYIVFALNAVLPAMALNGVGTKYQLQASVRNLFSREDLEIKEDRKLQAINRAAYALSLFSGISMSYVAYQVTKQFPLPFTIVFTASSYVGCYMFTLAAQKKLFKSFYNYARRGKTARQQCQTLQEDFLKSLKAVSEMEEEELEGFYNTFFSQSEEATTEADDQDCLNKIKDLMKLGEMVSLPPLSSCNEAGGKAARIIGGMIGATEVYITYVLAQSSIQLLCNAVGIHDPVTQNYLGKTCAVLACIPWGSLYAEGVSSTFANIYQAVMHKDRQVQGEFMNPKAKKGIAVYSVVGGAFTALPAVQLAMQTTEGLPLGLRYLMSGVTFLCTSAVFREALDVMLNQGLSWVKSFREDSIDLHREQLIQSIHALSLQLEDCPDPMIEALYRQRDQLMGAHS